jgi:hypothetical protein
VFGCVAAAGLGVLASLALVAGEIGAMLSLSFGFGLVTLRMLLFRWRDKLALFVYTTALFGLYYCSITALLRLYYGCYFGSRQHML